MVHGRDAELATLRAALADTDGGRGQLVLLAGEAGIGKSALAEVIAAEATARRARVTSGRAWEFAEAPPYFPLWPCMRSLGVTPPGEIEDGGAFELWERVLGALARESETGTQVWLLEDVHAADLGTLDLLTYLAQPIRAMRVLIVATLRPHDSRLDDRKLQRLARMGRDGIELRLEPLAHAAIARIAEDTIGRELPAHALGRLAELTGGNALFVVECARAFRAGGVERILEQLPPTVRHLVRERVALLPEATRRLLDAGAIVGREFAAVTVARMANVPPARAIDELLPALRAAVIRETRAGHFVFSHVVVRDAIEDAIPVDARVRLHADADAALRDLGDHLEILVERARHALAAAAGNPDHALALAHRAADQLEREGAFDRAFELRTRVQDARGAGLLPPATALEKLHLARLARDAGRLDVMKRNCEEVIEAARAGDPELFARAALLHATVVRLGVIDTRQLAWLDEARAALPAGTPTACRVLARFATALQPADDIAVPNTHAREALRGARMHDDDALLVDVLDFGALGLYGAPRPERIAWTEELRDLALRTGDVPRALTAWTVLAMWHAEGGALDRFFDACTEALVLADRAAHPRYRWSPLLLASGHACMLGNFAESERYAAEVGQIAALVDDPALEVALVAHAFERAKLRRRADEAAAPLAQLDHALRDFKHGTVVASVMRAGWFARLGDRDATRAELARMGTQARVFGREPFGMAMLAEAYALAGSDDDRRSIRDVLATYDCCDLFSYGIGYTYDSSLDRLLGLLDAALGDLASAETRIARELARATAHGMRPWIAQLSHELAAIVALRGRDPRELVEQAAAIARDLGMHGFGAPAPVPVAAPASQLRATRAGDVWTIERGTTVARVKDSRGMRLLARLLERPGEEVHVLALASDDSAAAPDSSAGEMLDDRARKAYRQRITDLDEALATAEQRGDVRSAERLEREKDALVRELARATGLGGRPRQAGSGTERARVNVQRRLKEAVQRIAEAEPGLGTFLERAIRTGTYCCFRP